MGSLGRVNYAPRLAESKGITGGLLHERQFLHGVRARGPRLDALEGDGALDRVPFRPLAGAGREALGGENGGSARAPGARGALPGHADPALPSRRRRSRAARADPRLGAGGRPAPCGGRGGGARSASLRAAPRRRWGWWGGHRPYSSRTSKASRTNSAVPSSPTLRSPTQASPRAGAVNS
ncbi:hypothetical protein FCH28_21300 [Streptomyces piniterrae]|uniref:Uncharacterized protein n=1 Tax=Streptomyces piniterrae TaxID=2571125 RepID=A0A4U0NB36_9ACTN|nr:hypothetical protein FCH28_21300 [Streptomyces piniterrae]